MMTEPQNIIVLLRHGQYTKEPVEQLTKLGKKQAKLAGKKLNEFNFDEVIVSTMPRAIETATIALSQFKKKTNFNLEDLIRESTPGFPVALRKKYKITDTSNFDENIKNADKAFKKYFKAKDVKKTTLLVCHGNIIRYLICKALGVDSETWIKLDVQQCGFSIIRYNQHKKSFELLTHNEIGHIDLKDRTFI